MLRPPPLLRDLTWGQAFIPFTADGRWLTPVGVVAMGAGLARRRSKKPSKKSAVAVL